MDALRKASGALFYLLGIVMIILVVLERRGSLPASAGPMLHVLDLPLLLIAFLYGGSSLYASLTKERTSMPLFFGIFLPLTLLFTLLAWFNFGTSFPPVF